MTSSASADAPVLSTLQVAAELALCPEAILVADAEDYAGTILSHLDSASELRAQLAAQHALADAASASVSALANAMAQGAADSQAVEQYQAAIAQLASANTALEATRQSLFETATEGIPTETLQRLAVWKSSAVFNIPSEFRAEQKTESEWKLLEGAIRAERRAQRRGETLDSQLAEALTAIRSDADVIAAATRLATDLDTVEAIFEAYE